MKVILKKDVDKVGQSGDVKEVKPGFARNFLFPRGFAAPATPAALASHEKSKQRRGAARTKTLDAAKVMAGKLAEVNLSFARQVGEGEKLFGSVGKSDIVKSLKASGYAVDKSQVLLDAALKEVGEFEVEVRLAPDASAKLKVTIAPRG